MTISANGYAAFSATTPLAPWQFDRRNPGPRDVQIEILFCGICHSDLHTVRGEWGPVTYPLVPGHEIVGRVVATGPEVTLHRSGDLVGVGCLVDSCHDCPSCRDGLEQYCELGNTGTYDGIEKVTGKPTQGGYSTSIVVDERYVLRIPAGIDPAAAAPLLCAGITTYSPLRHWKAGPGKRVGVVGIGGLGHMAVKIARAMGAHVVALTTSPAKGPDAQRLGAHDVVVSTDRVAMKAHRNSLDMIIDTVGTTHDLEAELRLLRLDGALVIVGLSPEPNPAMRAGLLVAKRRSIAGSSIGGIAETQEMLDFCAHHGIASDIELIRPEQINDAYERMLRSDVRYRFVIDVASMSA
ncbi:MAG: NAD(P)-dependent alcohol dehydrogenase [Gemmatimonas sp.]